MTMLPSLGFRLHHFRRLAWVSSEAEGKWKPVVASVRETVRSLEVMSFLAGMRNCYETAIHADGVSALGMFWKSIGKVFCVLGGNDLIRCVAANTNSDLTRYKEAFNSDDHRAMGLLNGYPDCCSLLYHEHLCNMVDPIWSIANSSNHNLPSISIENNLYFNNIILRVIGMTGIFHYPCSFNCIKSHEMGLAISNLASTFDKYKTSVTQLAEMLRWPMSWTVLHGIAEIKTPIFKLIYNSESTPTKYAITIHSDSYPVESGLGVTFPYDRTMFGPIKQTSPGVSKDKWYYEDNNFGSLGAMVTNHRPIVESAATLVSNGSGSILDLGCGNGALLKRICDRNTNLIPFGVDISHDKIQHAKRLHPLFKENFVRGNIIDTRLHNIGDSPFLLTLVSIARLVEIPTRKGRNDLFSDLKSISRFLLFYAYPDSQKFGPIKEILTEVSVEMTVVLERPNIVIIKP